MNTGEENTPNAVDLLGEDETTTTTDTTAATPTTPPAFDASVFGKEIGAQVAEALKSQRVSEQPDPKPQQMTPEQAKALLKIWEPDDQFVQRFGNLETQKAAFIEMRDKLTEQMVAMLGLNSQDLHKTLRAEYEPALTYVRTKDVADRESRFFDANPDFKEPAMRPILEAVTQHLAKEGKLSGDEKANFAAIAAGVEATIKLHNPTFTRTGAAPVVRSKPSSSNGLAVTTPGGGGGGGNKGASPEHKTKAVALLS